MARPLAATKTKSSVTSVPLKPNTKGTEHLGDLWVEVLQVTEETEIPLAGKRNLRAGRRNSVSVVQSEMGADRSYLPADLKVSATVEATVEATRTHAVLLA